MKDLQEAGPPLAEYRPGRARRSEAAAIWVLGLPALPLCLIGLLQTYLGYTKYGPVAAQIWSRPWISAALLLGALSLGLALRRVVHQNRRVTVHSSGLRLRALDPFPYTITSLVKPTQLPWESLTGIATETVAGRRTSSTRPEQILRSRITLFCIHRPPLHIPGAPNGLKDLPELASRIKAAVYPRRMPELLASFYTGAPQRFGPLTITRAGLAARPGWPGWKSEQFAWQEIQRVSIEGGQLVVELKHRNDSKHNAPPLRRVRHYAIAQIPNPELLLELIQEGATQ